jgi:solute carrier family 39 (zinc transporter), member 1/2/3
MIALCVHSVFEGIACGLQKDEALVLEMVIATVVHKGAAASALGISLVKSFPEDFTLVRQLVCIFAFSTPIGVIIGMFASNAGDLVDVIMSSLAGGTFIYIGASEIIVNEFSSGGYKVHKFIAYLCGSAMITSLCFMKGA